MKLAENNPEIAEKVRPWERQTNFKNKYAGYNSCLMAHEWLSEMNAQPIPKTEDVLSKCQNWLLKLIENKQMNGRKLLQLQGSEDLIQSKVQLIL